MNILDKFHHWRRKIRWNKQYKSGRWDSLQSELESNRYKQIIAYLHAYTKPNPSILDLGCGDGMLNIRMQESSYGYSYFMGVDFSSVSIEKALEKKLPNTDFIVEDIIKFVPVRKYDVIIFNEAFYYIPETEKNRVLNLILDHLEDDGMLLVSIFRDGPGCWEYFKENERLLEKVFTTVTTNKKTTYWKLGFIKN